MAKTKQSDGTYLLKLVLYLILGSQWIFITDQAMTWQIPIPVGFIIGLLFAFHEQFKIDRKIEYAVLAVAMFVGFWANAGITIELAN